MCLILWSIRCGYGKDIVFNYPLVPSLLLGLRMTMMKF